eukprot:gene13001-8847_t
MEVIWCICVSNVWWVCPIDTGGLNSLSVLQCVNLVYLMMSYVVYEYILTLVAMYVFLIVLSISYLFGGITIGDDSVIVKLDYFVVYVCWLDGLL